MLLYILIFSEILKDFINYINKVGKKFMINQLKRGFKLQGYVKDFDFIIFKLGQNIFLGYGDLVNR